MEINSSGLILKGSSVQMSVFSDNDLCFYETSPSSLAPPFFHDHPSVMSQGAPESHWLRPPVVLSLSHAEAAEKYLFAASCNQAININKYFRIFVLINSAIVLQSWEQNDSGDVGYME